ncbi:SpoIIE family protein phosphatase [Streptosporangium sp. NBC_01639]|uniref:PP2C family protein-serine/threonine phosphatase n=1 Tax=unclassified Streptosporangium TaxID=2632669 RepID=UPI002DD88F7A|nr:SpoIIE family protein phosphatase [Streptosporangium sp. NBC_01756]WSC82899.1 SpoIIE family protein phosphatase [Streptosporangium sp. NBC_01756]WTD58550.1 SpoIIE family protein phosphatase [Streptosporangium sp. NBC_01639]
MTNAPRAVLAATFAPGDTAVPAVRRFTREVMTAWAATPLLAQAEQLAEEFAAQVPEAPFEVIWSHFGNGVRLEVRRKDAPGATPDAPTVPVDEWGVTFAGEHRVHWARLHLSGSTERVAAEWSTDQPSRGPVWLGFLADASDLLAGTLDPDMVPAIISQIVVPRLATWCAVYTWSGDGGPQRPAYLWHTDERRIDGLREELLTAQIPQAGGSMQLGDSQMLVIPLLARGRALGAMCLGRPDRFAEDVFQYAEDIGRRAALAMDNARLYATQAAANRALQRSLLPPNEPGEIPGLDPAVVYEPAGETNEVGGDFYDLFAAGDGSWRFAVGDVCGTGPEAAAVTGLARHTLRLLAREGYGVAAVLDRLNQAILEEGERARFLTLLHGEIKPVPTGLDVWMVSAGHPEAIRLRPTGVVDTVVTSQSLLGVFPEATFKAELVHLDPGDVLLAVTDGVTERRQDGRLLDDDGGLAKLLAECVGLSARAVAERIRRAVQDFAPEPSADDLAIVVLRAR